MEKFQQSSEDQKEIVDEVENKQNVEDEQEEDEVDENEFEIPSDILEFLRNEFSAPQSMLSSPFAKHLTVAVAGPSKPIWYKQPTFRQFTLFKHLVSLLEDGCEEKISFYQVLYLIQELAPTVTAIEMVHVLKKIGNQDEDADLGEFFFLLANNPFYDVILKAPRYQTFILKNLFTPRQRLFYSNVAFYCLVQTEDDIERFYRMKSVQHRDILRFHMASVKTFGLSEEEMEKKQNQTLIRMQLTCTKFDRTSPYNTPVPFVRSSKKEPHYLKFIEDTKNMSKALYPETPHMYQSRYIRPYKVKRPLGTPVKYETKEEELIHQFLMSKLPRPDMIIPVKRLKEMRNRIRVDQNDYLELKKAVALKEYYDRQKLAIVTFSRRQLARELARGFPSESSKLLFFDFFKSMMPLSVNEFFLMHPWTHTLGDRSRPRPKFERPAFGKAGD